MKPRPSASCRRLRILTLLIGAAGLWPSLAWATVHAQSDANRSPFPSDRFTVADLSVWL